MATASLIAMNKKSGAKTGGKKKIVEDEVEAAALDCCLDDAGEDGEEHVVPTGGESVKKQVKKKQQQRKPASSTKEAPADQETCEQFFKRCQLKFPRNPVHRRLSSESEQDDEEDEGCAEVSRRHVGKSKPVPSKPGKQVNTSPDDGVVESSEQEDEHEQEEQEEEASPPQSDPEYEPGNDDVTPEEEEAAVTAKPKILRRFACMRPFRGGICGRLFNTKYEWTGHEKVHLDPNARACPTCWCVSTSPQWLSRHNRLGCQSEMGRLPKDTDSASFAAATGPMKTGTKQATQPKIVHETILVSFPANEAPETTTKSAKTRQPPRAKKSTGLPVRRT